MPVSSDIYGMVGRGVQPLEDPQNAMLKALQVQGARMQGQQAQQGMEDDRALREATMASGGDQNKLMQLLYGRGQYKAAAGVQKSIQDAEKARADVGHVKAQTAQSAATAAKTAQETKFAAATQHAQNVINVQTPEDAVAYIDDGIARGVFPAEARDQAIQKLQSFPSIDAWKQAQTQAAIPVLERMKTEAENARNAATNQTSRLNNQDTNATSRANNQATVGATIRGQNLLDFRSKETIGLQRERLNFDKTKADDKPLNDTQSKALLFGSRMREADTVLESLAKSGTKASVPGSRAGYGVGAVVTALSSAQQQQLDQAKRDFLSAVLRRESGAVISDSEFENGDKQYFPQIGDSKEVIAQKARNRKLATDGILQEVPEGKRQSLKPTPQMPTADDVRKQADAILKGG